MVPAHTLGSVTPETGVIVTGAVGPGGQATAATVIEVTESVLPRVKAGNFAGEMPSVSTWEAPPVGLAMKAPHGVSGNGLATVGDGAAKSFWALNTFTP